ncbi:MAG: glutamine-hydrolyzing carbamoyl-phosphate synthase small subunit [Bacteroidetes bacterium]|nr:glutamine-hydrolyzing carbamoyl-phosphate synthase small subunit [Bacteroidota bacterium]MBK8144828.1 glutamine-hydrolyzing carbamoyl-phosphate synthase small subunit [Bacteroidota bacterium]MBP6316075.1 glutamine-hydrolyzing carbamoyl-phosphate synthase small subunit [Chitinophagaceae bacterium]
MNNQNKAFLLLADGTYFEGKAFGALGTATGEICFNTGMTGYQEVFTDPSYFGQIIIMNTAHVGNYGARNTDIESDSVKISGLICKNLSSQYSRTLADSSLEDYLLKNKVVAIHGIDTRALVAHVRSKGAMNCIISSDTTLSEEDLKQLLAKVPSMDGRELASLVSTKEAYTLGDATSSKRVAVIDFGVKKSILASMVERGAFVKVFPSDTTFEHCEEFSPNAYFVSNGPGDPSAMPQAVEVVKKILGSNKPLFGICLGHQLIALASGATTYKMHHGHRGLNHPVLNLQTMRSEISTQNHGFAVDKASVESIEDLEITHINLNDGTLEGIKSKKNPAFSVQYHPEATPGPHDSRYLFDQFIAMI